MLTSKENYPALTTVLETKSHILIVVSATRETDTAIAITINDMIRPYSIAVAPSWHRRMFFIFFNIFFCLSIRLRTASFFHKRINKFFKSEKKMENKPTLLFVVAIALMDQNGKILMQTRPLGKTMAGLWEFPGGKVEEGELPDFAIVRELKEELNISISRENLIPACFASEPLGNRYLLLLLYIADIWSGDIIAREGQKFDWFDLDELSKLKMPPADIPLVANLRKILQNRA